MLFRRRIPETLQQKIRLCLWPRRSFARSARYFGRRLLRIPASPHIIALGFAIGIFFASTPLYGFHILCALFVAWILSANMAAAALGTVLANPFTIPFLFSAAYETGRLVLPISDKSAPIPVLLQDLHNRDFSGLAPALFQISVGSALIGLALAAAAYMLSFYMVRRAQSERGRRLKARAAGRGRRLMPRVPRAASAGKYAS